MAVTSFALDSAVDGLVTTLRAATGFKAPAEAGSDVPVFDGPAVSQASTFAAVVIGSDGDPGGVQRPVRFSHEWHDLDMTTRESGQVQCAVVVWSGDANPDTFASQRASACDILEDVDQAIRASINATSVGVDQLLWSLITSGELIQAATPNGTETRLPFVWSYEALNQVT